MCRFGFLVLLPMIGVLLSYQLIVDAVPQSRMYNKKIMSNKAIITSNISMALYLAVRKFIPINMTPKPEEWLNIDGSADQYPPGEKYTPTNYDILF